MSAVAAAEVPHGTPDTFGGLLRDGETPEAALRRLEKTKGYAKTIGSDDGQRLLAAATAQVASAPNGGIPMKPKVCRGGHPGWRNYICIACGKDVRGKVPGAFPDAGDGAVLAIAPAAPDAHFKSPESAGVRLLDLDLSLIDVGENVRVDSGELDELTTSIRELGVLQPIRVVGPHADGRYRAVWGQRRILASRLAEKDTIPAIVEASAEADAPGARRSIEQLAENLQRKDLNPIEEAVALRAVLDATPGLTQEKLADQLGRSRPWVSNALRLLELVEPVQDLIRAGTLSQSHAKAIASVDADLQTEFAGEIVRSKWSTADAERQAKWKKESAARIREEIAQAAQLSKTAVAALEKVARRDGATIAAGGYGVGERIAKLLTADGWKVIPDRWDIEAIASAASCGCKGIWKVSLTWTPKGQELSVRPACNNPEHRKARDAERDKRYARERAKADAERKAQEEIDRRQALRLAGILQTDKVSTLRLAIYALGIVWTLEEVLGIDEDDEVLDSVSPEADYLWAAIEKLSDDDVAGVLAKCVAFALDDHWRVGQGAKDAIAALLASHPEPNPPPERPAKGKKAAAAAAS